MTSITHWCNWLLRDDPSITHRLLYCIRKTLYLLSCTFFFFVWDFLSALDAFSLYLKFLLPMSRCKVLITNVDDSQSCNISICPTLYLITKQLDSNQPVWKLTICKTEQPWRGNRQGMVQQVVNSLQDYREEFYISLLC